MKKYVILLGFMITISLSARVSTDRIKGWLELDHIQKNMQILMQKYDALDNQLTQDANEVLAQGINGADELAKSDPYAALVMYHKIKTVKDVGIQRSAQIIATKKRFQELSDYVDLQYKQLRDIRLKHLRFPY